MNFHRDGRTHTPGKAAKSLFYFESRLQNMGELGLSKHSSAFIWQQLRPYGEIPPQGGCLGALGQNHMRVPLFFCSIQAGTKRGQGARGTFPTQVVGHSFSPSALGARDQGGMDGHVSSSGWPWPEAGWGLAAPWWETVTSDQQGSVRWPAKGSTVSLLGVFAPNFSVMLEGWTRRVYFLAVSFFCCC